MKYLCLVLMAVLSGCGQINLNNPIAGAPNSLISRYKDLPCASAPPTLQQNPPVLFPFLPGLNNLGVWGCSRESSTLFFLNKLYVFTYGNVFDSLGQKHYGAKVYDFNTKQLVSFDDQPANFPSAIVKDDTVYYFHTDFNKIYVRTTADLITWTKFIPVLTIDDEDGFVYNTSITKGPDKYVMTYEISNGPMPYSFKVATSTDLIHWTKVGERYSNLYSACAYIRYANGAYNIIYLIGESGVLYSVATRTQDFITYSPPSRIVVAPGLGDGINASDVDMFEYQGMTYLTYINGNQINWGVMMLTEFAGTADQFFEAVWN